MPVAATQADCIKAPALGAGMLRRVRRHATNHHPGPRRTGAQLAGNVLAMAFFAEGREVQSFATYGGARRGTPVSSFIRVDDKPIRVRCDIERADAILCFDASLLEGAAPRRCRTAAR